ncbi:GPP34 family phosphoprotein [Aeromicrobium sp.]|uniref:GOLPH3/VPS74 family protein n=1 Tax=Aeromicrobium sp. TaxID=1871063 RepID=UPI0030BA5B7A
MTTAEDLLLIVTDPVSGKPQLDSMKADPVVGGAHLLDLVASGRLDLDGEGRKARVVVSDHAPLSDPVLEGAMARIRNRGRQSPQNAVTKLGKQGRKTVYAALVTKGLMKTRPKKLMGLFPLTRHEVVDTARRDDLVNRIRASLMHDQPADSETGPLIGLLAAADLTKLLVEKPDRKRAKARAKVIAEGDWASEGVRTAIQAAQAAVTAGVMVATVAGTAGSN